MPAPTPPLLQLSAQRHDGAACQRLAENLAAPDLDTRQMLMSPSGMKRHSAFYPLLMGDRNGGLGR